MNYGGDAGAQQNALERCTAEPVKHQLQLVAGNFFQAVTHKAHAVQEQCHTAQQGYDVGYTHPLIPPINIPNLIVYKIYGALSIAI